MLFFDVLEHVSNIIKPLGGHLPGPNFRGLNVQIYLDLAANRTILRNRVIGFSG